MKLKTESFERKLKETKRKVNEEIERKLAKMNGILRQTQGEFVREVTQVSTNKTATNKTARKI